ncbi:hypothetical protein [Nocardia spumae]|uniref:hypothetical protein n=1 Tax=Nocardia spumae TaxID=2887190 RepID=UPI001D13643F|nr:hypothetical protein [Nocardia spumae]
MSEASGPTTLAEWLRGHAVPLTRLDPDGPLDDLEPLGEIIGGARVVAIGESSHFITEFERMRRRILRFLVERCGFTVEPTPLQRPEQGSIEASFTDAGLGPGLADLRHARREVTSGPDRTRLQSAYLHIPVLDAFDAMLNTASSSVADDGGR